MLPYDKKQAEVQVVPDEYPLDTPLLSDKLKV
jgi:hypothetical protein